MAVDRSETFGMNKCSIKNHIIICLAITASSQTAILCQADTLSLHSDTTSIHYKSSDEIHSLYSGIGAGSNMIYLGSSISNNKPFYSAAVTYGYKNSLFASATASHLSGTNPYIAFYNAALIYRHTFNSWFDISSSLAGYKAAESLQDSLFADFADITLTTGFDWRLLYTRITFSGLISEENGFYLQISNSRYFETPVFFNGKALVSFDPDIDMLFGNLVSVENASGNEIHGNAPPFSHARKKPAGSTATYSEKFGLIDLQFSLPVTFSWGKFSIEAEPVYLLPVFSDPAYTEPEGFVLFINVIFKIF
jgi:hypothetical protein